MKIHTCWKLAAFFSFFSVQTAVAQDAITILFEGTGAEAGIITPSATDFTFMGSSWSGGFNATQGIGAFYASGRFAYHVDAGSATVVFDPPVTNVRFFYVHGGSFGPGSATAFSTNGTNLESHNSNLASGFGAPANFVNFDTNEPIAMIQFDGGVIDNFSYTPTAVEDFDFQTVEGSWLNPNVVGSGILFDYGASVDRMFVTWVTHSLARQTPTDPAPSDDIGFSGQRSINALLTLNGNVASGELFVVEGGQFDTPADATQRSRVVGNISVTFSGCNNGHLEYSFDPPVNISGSFDIIQLEAFVSPSFVCGNTQ